MRVEETTYQMLWDCKYCGARKLLGLTHRFCPSCGAPQDADKRYFPAEHEKVEVQNHPYVGADLQCPGCASWNGRAAKHCVAPFQGQGGPAKKKSPIVAILIAVGAVLFLGVVGLVCTAIFWKKPGALAVTGHAWQRSIEIERYGKYTDSAWCDAVPAGAREVSRRREQRSTKQVQDGEECSTRKKDNGDGTFKQVRECKPKYKDAPVYADKCTYEAEAWKTDRWVDAKGSNVKETPAWPKVSLTRTGTCLGCEREGERKEQYTVRFSNAADKKEHTCDLPQAKWQTFPVGAHYEGQIGVLTGALDCDSLVKK
jgi:hypothetical protein